jgi:hypothetical protein
VGGRVGVCVCGCVGVWARGCRWVGFPGGWQASFVVSHARPLTLVTLNLNYPWLFPSVPPQASATAARPPLPAVWFAHHRPAKVIPGALAIQRSHTPHTRTHTCAHHTHTTRTRTHQNVREGACTRALRRARFRIREVCANIVGQ